MKVLGMGLPELLIILAVVLLIFGPKHLPKLGAALGSTVKNLRQGLGSDKEEEIEEIIEEDKSPKSAKALESDAAKKTTRSKTRSKSSAPVEE